jgi:sulfatase modifying factor 1
MAKKLIRSRLSTLVLALLAHTSVSASHVQGQTPIPTTYVGNLGNPSDPSTGFGSVSHGYRIGSTEVTNNQYAAFLNATAWLDTNDLYNPNMGITRSGSPGTYSYSAITGRESHPVNFVSFWDTCRFANWLHNGQPQWGVQVPGTTETGAYTMTPDGIAANNITRNEGWQWAVASENEWYKAAYHQPASQGGDVDDYWLFPTSSNTATTADANYNGGDTMPVGSFAANFYGAFDMGGNVWEWNESIILNFTTNRGVRGGSFAFPQDYMWSSNRGFTPPGLETSLAGFRVVTVPGPSSLALLVIGGLTAVRRRR